LGAREHSRIAGTGTAASRVVGIPLRKSATGRGSQNNDAQQEFLLLLPASSMARRFALPLNRCGQRTAQAYALISQPTAMRVMVGLRQDMLPPSS